MASGIVLSSSPKTLSGTHAYVYGPASGAYAVTNLGTIAATGTTVAGAVYLKVGGKLINGSDAVTNAAVSGYGTNAGVAIVGAPGTVANFGTILGGAYGRGVELYDGGTVINGSASDTLAAIAGGGAYAAVFIDGTTNGIPGSPTNPGHGGGGNGILIANGNADQGNSSTIINYGILGPGGAGNEGIRIDSPLAVPITNFGTVLGSIGIRITAAAGTVTNAGTISGSTGTAILFQQPNDRLVLDPGAVLVGRVVALGSGNVLELAAGTAGTLSGLGTEFSGFENTTVDAGAHWQLGGANTLAAGTTLTVVGTLTNAGSLVGAGKLVLDGGQLSVGSGFATSIGIDMAGPAVDTLIVPGGVYGTIANAITGLGLGDRIEMTGIPFNTAIVNGAELQLAIDGVPLFAFTNVSFNGVANPQFTFELDQANIELFAEVACFAAGTHLLTAAGEFLVEAVRPEMLLPSLTHARPMRVRWVGHRQMDCAAHPRPCEVWPVRIAAHAFTPDRPHRDLLLSPDHAVALPDEHGRIVLIPVRYLVNGATIVQEARDRLSYYHIELESHGVVVAEGIAAESYLDTGNRHAFANVANTEQSQRTTALTPSEARF